MKQKEFKIHSICVVKNEVDIIEYCLGEACKWSDFIYIYDNGSTDGTWETVQRLNNTKIICWKQDNKPFKEALRGEIFNEFQDRVDNGDWWCRLDADEFYLTSPRQTLINISPYHHVLWGIPIEYYLVPEDINKIDFKQPIEEILSKICFYKAENSEARFFKHRKGLRWSADGSWPNHMGIVSPERILYRHYKYRSPDQIQRRLKTRQDAIRRGFPGWEHAKSLSWEEQLANSTNLHYDNGDGHFIVDVEKLPNHKASFSRRLLQYLMHTTGIWA